MTTPPCATLTRIAFLAALLLSLSACGPGASTASDRNGSNGTTDLCTGATVSCGGQCVDTRTDAAHCGACNRPCAPGLLCAGGSCAASCAGTETECNGVCVNTQTSPTHCGRCNNPCTGGEVCAAGICSASCGTGLQECLGSCVDTSSSAEHCGACDHRCSAPGSEASCVDSICSGWACLPGFSDTNGDVSDGCESACAGQGVYTPGVLDLNLEVVHITGSISVGGLAAGPAAGPWSRGTLVFHHAGGSRSVSFDLGSSGPALYDVQLFAGDYTIELTNVSDCIDGVFQCGTQVLAERFTFLSDGNLDLNALGPLPPVVPFVVSGELTLDGAAMPDAMSSRGTLYFVGENGGTATADLGSLGSAFYEVTLVADTYHIYAETHGSCPTGPIPCQRRTLHEALLLQQTGVLTLNLDTARIFGQVFLNGAGLPTSSDGVTPRGLLALHDQEGEVTVDLGSSGPALYEVVLYTGTYDFELRNDRDCPATGFGALPCQPRVVRAGQLISASGTLDLRAEAYQLSGVVSVNGGLMPASVTGGERGHLTITDDAGAPLRISLGSSGVASYNAYRYAATYEIAFTNSVDCPADRPGATPCQTRILNPGLLLSSAGIADFDLPVLQATINVTVGGGVMPTSSNARSRGRLILDELAGAGAVFTDLGISGAVSKTLQVFPGDYVIRIDNSGCAGDALPCQATVADTITIFTHSSFDTDLTVAQVSGQVFVNGSVMADDSAGSSRGQVLFVDSQGAILGAPIGPSGPALYDLRMFAGSYDVGFANFGHCVGGVVPCQEILVQQGLSIAGVSALDIPLTVVEIGGEITVNGAAMSASVTGAPRGSVSFIRLGGAQPIRADLGAVGPAIYQVRLFAGEYQVVFDGNDCPSSSVGATPCQDTLLRGCR